MNARGHSSKMSAHVENKWGLPSNKRRLGYEDMRSKKENDDKEGSRECVKLYSSAT